MRFTLAVTLLLASTLTGCGTTTVSSALPGNSSVKTAIAPDGYTIHTSAAFSRPAAANSVDQADCSKSQINDIETSPVKSGSSIQVSGKTSFYYAAVGMSKAPSTNRPC